ncbi:3-oxoacyl-ACP reductase FabG [Rhodococcus sp. DMU1]|uniref:3-oxoacyl-ACP reductase FabG n=1 Tax=Rhodococcus sp. DMU1 TaxID=2722825 RepID=UPI00143E3DBE|nr:3-oxoacyl-ACP reductase FabG [Rhodococcus sp. DMU1]QIX53870.1 3-oxoacyl-ACP reductase FabG [Rhodococcus sp. DMU1]
MSETSHTVRRVAVITGAARGIGAATAKRLAQDGFTVALLDLDEAACAETVGQIIDDGGQALAIGTDVADRAHVTSAIERVATELGPPVVLVNNAGVTRDNLLVKMVDSEWDLVMNVHLKGAYLMTQAVLPHMREAGWGRIVNLSSASALGNRGQANYSAAKAGLQGFTKTMAIEAGPYGVTVNAIAPGFIATDMTAATAERLGVAFDDFKATAAEKIPVRRVGRPEDIAGTASFLVGDDASFVSGQVLYVAGGPRA